MLIRFSIVFLVLSFVVGCNGNAGNSTDVTEPNKEEVLTTNWGLNWMIGEWFDSTKFKGENIFVENWVKESEQLLSGEKYSIKKGDTLSPTKLSITKTDGKFYYSYTVKGDQITFVQDSISKGFISFRNTTNVFPDVLTYFMNSDTLEISFSGIKSGMKFGTTFYTINKKNIE